ncbi:hypothetical protein [Mycobacterium sp.]|uniref:hypothetical protein n=1 Tax=Mycobacterium sp. TaxID=1785 RepID=UPI002BBCA0F3|nr:hypothetical protein [Mycobacterium sp.]HTY35298.1 hypothetical protein [Mycobacterium sp.]
MPRTPEGAEARPGSPRPPPWRSPPDAGDCRRKPASPGRLGRFTRSPVLAGALNAVSTFIRSHAADRFDLLCTAKPYEHPRRASLPGTESSLTINSAYCTQ